MIISKRVALSLKPELDEVITELAELNGISKTTIITAMLTDLLPHLKLLLKTLKKAKVAEPQDALNTLKSLMDDSEQVFNEAQMSLIELEKNINEQK